MTKLISPSGIEHIIPQRMNSPLVSYYSKGPYGGLLKHYAKVEEDVYTLIGATPQYDNPWLNNEARRLANYPMMRDLGEIPIVRRNIIHKILEAVHAKLGK